LEAKVVDWPDELWLMVLATCDAESLYCVSFVDRRLHRLASDDALWRRHVLDIHPYEETLPTKRGWKNVCFDLLSMNVIQRDKRLRLRLVISDSLRPFDAAVALPAQKPETQRRCFEWNGKLRAVNCGCDAMDEAGRWYGVVQRSNGVVDVFSLHHQRRMLFGPIPRVSGLLIVPTSNDKVFVTVLSTNATDSSQSLDVMLGDFNSPSVSVRLANLQLEKRVGPVIGLARVPSYDSMCVLLWSQHVAVVDWHRADWQRTVPTLRRFTLHPAPAAALPLSVAVTYGETRRRVVIYSPYQVSRATEHDAAPTGISWYWML
jgi:hypothetical protein